MSNENFDFGINYGNTANFNPDDALANAEDVILAIFLYDLSGSMWKYMATLNEARKSCIEAWQKSHHAPKILYSEVTFSDEVQFSHGFTPISLVDSSTKLDSDSQTALFEAIQVSIDHAVEYRKQILDAGGEAKIMLFCFTDGEDNPVRSKVGQFTTDSIKSKLGEIYGEDESLRSEMDAFIISIDKSNNSYFEKIANETGLPVLIQKDDNRTIAEFLRENINVASQSVSSGSSAALSGMVI